mmetsp:Transcript_73391/g.129495  ORF Transcript_73391/g.129495 Transcript_73391/m.129495 type:complete len:355 (-) Transcript_73391:55-1119(-)
MDALTVSTMSGTLQTVGVGVAVTAFVSHELLHRFGLRDVNLKDCAARILCRSWPESLGLFCVLSFALLLRMFMNPDRGLNVADASEVMVWDTIKKEWPILQGADTLLSVQSMLRMLVWMAVVLRTTLPSWQPSSWEFQPLSGSTVVLSLASATARASLAQQTIVYSLDGPLGGYVPIFCEVLSVPLLAAISLKAASKLSVSYTGGSLAIAAWFASRNYLNLSGSEVGGDFQHDKLFILAHCLELLASLSFLANTIRSSCDSHERRRSAWTGFVHLLLPTQQALSAYYFLTAFDPHPNLVGSGRPFCLLCIGNLLQLAVFLCAFAFYLADLLGARTDESTGPARNEPAPRNIICV